MERFGPARSPTTASTSTSPEALLAPAAPDATPSYGAPLGAGGARLVILEAPAGLSFGIDSMSYTTGENFRGVRGVPVGLHLCHHGVGVGGGEGEGGGADGSGGRHGFFFRIAEPTDVIVWKWDAGKEDLVPAQTAMPEGALAALDAAAVRGHLDGQLGPYPTEQAPVWAKLSQYLTDALFARCELPTGTKVLPGDAELDSDDEPVESAVVSYFGESGRAARFTTTPPPLPRLKKPSQIVPAASSEQGEGEGQGVAGGGGDDETAGVPNAPSTVPTRHAATLAAIPSDKRTVWCIDTGARCETLVDESFAGQWELLLGELQLAFLLFTLLYSAPALAHWKQSLALLCSCGHATVQRQHRVFTALCRLLQVQLRFLPEDFFMADLSKDNFLKPTLAGLFATVAYVQADACAVDCGSAEVVEVGSAGEVEFEGEAEAEAEGTDISAPASMTAYTSLWKSRDRLLVLVQKRFGLWVEVSSGCNFSGDTGDAADAADAGDDANGASAATTRMLLEKVGALTGFEDDDELPVVVDMTGESGRVGGGHATAPGGLDYSRLHAMAADMSGSDSDSDDKFLSTPGVSAAGRADSNVDGSCENPALAAQYPLLYSARRVTEDVMMAATRLVSEADAPRGGNEELGRWMTPTESAMLARAQAQALAFLEAQAKPGSEYWKALEAQAKVQVQAQMGE